MKHGKEDAESQQMVNVNNHIINEQFSVAQIHNSIDFNKLQSSFISRSLNATFINEDTPKERVLQMSIALPQDVGLPPSFVDNFGMS